MPHAAEQHISKSESPHAEVLSLCTLEPRLCNEKPLPHKTSLCITTRESQHATTESTCLNEGPEQPKKKKKKKIRGILGIDFQVSQGRGYLIATPDVSLPVKELY